MTQQQRKRRRRGSLSRAEVVDKAIEIATARGLDFLSMPVLARELGVGVMTLYGYVSNKEDLLEAMSERALTFTLPPLDTKDPLAALESYARVLRAQLLAHPALIDLFRARRTWSPSVANAFEHVLSVLTEEGSSLEEAVAALHAVQTYTLGFVLYEVHRVHSIPYGEHVRRWRLTLAELSPEQYPLLNEARDLIPTAALEPQFEYGLTALMRGMHLGRSRDTASHRPASAKGS